MRVLIVAVVCCLLFASSVDCKKVAKDEKAGKGKEVKAEKKEKVQKVVVEKVVEVPVEEEQEVEIVEEVVEVVKPKIVKPKSLKVLSAFEQCKAECRKQRDSVHAQDYVEQLRTELAAAEQALADQKAAAEAAADAETHATV